MLSSPAIFFLSPLVAVFLFFFFLRGLLPIILVSDVRQHSPRNPLPCQVRLCGVYFPKQGPVFALLLLLLVNKGRSLCSRSRLSSHFPRCLLPSRCPRAVQDGSLLSLIFFCFCGSQSGCQYALSTSSYCFFRPSLSLSRRKALASRAPSPLLPETPLVFGEQDPILSWPLCCEFPSME